MSPIPSRDARERRLLAAGVVLIALLALSGARPYDRLTWLLEVAPVLIALPLLVATYRRFPLSTLAYTLIFAHAVVLMVGGAYTYARVPIGHDVAHLFGLARNPYDKLGHFMQGFVPAIVAREILLRGDFVRGRRMLVFIVLSIVLAISASYELVEWASALALGQGADEFLGTQGDAWDTQSDMFAALVGGASALALLARWHDRQLAALAPCVYTETPAGLEGASR
jgi:putative membrane protein